MGEFTTDWFSGAIDGIQRSLDGVHVGSILEIGSWEGRSACWFLERFPHASIVCVDTFAGSEEHHQQGIDVTKIKERFIQNTARFGDRVCVLHGPSSSMLFGLQPGSFDVAYVDGSHTEADALSDLVMAFHLLRPGGILLVDDYAQGLFPGIKTAVDGFSKAYSDRMRCILCDYQVHFVKLS